ncbi:MAG: UvrD-helicase domain-containing protein, partial [Methanomethylovorans sp.]|uniref:UvrD-helicase domain-containing protein n=1 Tax=Methanomethylovorans sp. TaxID=2758717 RepID=UPI003C7702A1
MTRSSEKVHGCPGTGKTTTLLRRLEALLCCYRPEDITVTTFRRTTARELIQAFKGTQAQTLHSLCRKLLNGPDIMSDRDYAKFGVTHGYKIKRRDLSEDQVSGDPVDCYSWLRNTFTPIEDAYLYPGYDDISHVDLDRFVTEYEGFKQEAGKVDFTDLLTMVMEDRTPLDTPVLMVDEYQDLTPLQDAVIKMWNTGTDNTIIAGDPAQSIYGVFGGSPELFKGFEVDTNTILEESHRLYTPIWGLARDTLAAERQDTPDIVTREAPYSPICDMSFDDPYPVHPGTVLHLVRCNYQAPAIALQLAEAGQLFSGLGGWSDNEIRLFNVILKMRAGEALQRFDMYTLLRYYPDHVQATAEELKHHRTTNKPPITPGLYEIMRTPNPVAYIKDSGKLFNMKILQALKSRKAPISYEDLTETRLLTIHGAKGAEADTVFLHTGITPKINKSIKIPGPDSEAEARV